MRTYRFITMYNMIIRFFIEMLVLNVFEFINIFFCFVIIKDYVVEVLILYIYFFLFILFDTKT